MNRIDIIKELLNEDEGSPNFHVVPVDGYGDMEFEVLDWTHIKHRPVGETKWGAMALLHIAQLSDTWKKALVSAGVIDSDNGRFNYVEKEQSPEQRMAGLDSFMKR